MMMMTTIGNILLFLSKKENPFNVIQFNQIEIIPSN